MDSSMDDECPVCMGPFLNPSQPVPCCRKVFCQSCLKQALLVRPQCPYCRSPINTTTLAVRSAIRHAVRLHGNNASLRTTQTVGPNLQALLTQLRAANAQLSQTASASNVSLPNQVASNTAVQATGHPAFTPWRRPVPRPRGQATSQVAPAAPVTPAPNPVIIQADPSPQLDLQADGNDDIDLQVQIAAMENTSHSGNMYNCPYCQEGGLDDLDLRDHCNDNHLHDQRRVVCPVCVSLPHGNPTYHSRDFIGHLNLRHSYYIEDITNVYQNDDINLQDAILRSCQDR